MSGWYYLNHDRADVEGPVDNEKFLELAERGGLSLKSSVRHKKHTNDEWVPADRIPAVRKRIEGGQTVMEAAPSSRFAAAEEVIAAEAISDDPPIAASSEKQNLVGLIQTVSGNLYHFTEIRLFNATALAVADNLKTSMLGKVDGLASGITPLGFGSAAMATSAVMSAVEAAIGSTRISEGKKIFSDYMNSRLGVAESGRFIELGRIENIQVPSPEHWRAVEIGADGRITSAWMFNDDPFITVRLFDGSITTIFWSAIERYEVSDVPRREFIRT